MADMIPEAGELIPRPDRPIAETASAVSYLGVRLEKAANSDSPFVTSREKYRDFTNDRFSLDLQKQIAVSFLQGDPLLIEGGTSIGKTTTVRKMAAELGWEVHFVNLKGSSDADELMGKYIPNPDRHTSDDPEYIFADGKVTQGLRQEEGKTKVIILDEINAASPNVLIRLHEILDVLERGENVVLTEDASEAVATDKRKTKLVALMNPPGKGYFGREPLDPAQLRRWTYIKAASDLPAETFSYATKSLFGLAPQIEAVDEASMLVSRDQVLLPEQLEEIPGIGEIVARYEEFHKAAKQLVRERKIGADQPQLFTFDDRVEPRRVRNFILHFYNGDINATFQAALRYYYANKVESAEDKEKLLELISHVEYQPTQATSSRRPLDRPEASQLPPRAPGLPEADRTIASITEAARIFGNDFILPDALDSRLTPERPPIPFSRSELERAKELGQFLVLRTDKAPDGTPLTMGKMQQLLQERFDREGKGKVLYEGLDWYKGEDLFTRDTPRAGWALVSKQVIPNSTSKNYLQQTEQLAAYLISEVFVGMDLPPQYKAVIDEYQRQKSSIEGLMRSDWQAAAKALGELRLNQIARQAPVEVIYDLMAYYLKNGERLLADRWTWTNKQSSDGDLVGVGTFDPDGALVGRDDPDIGLPYLGVVLSR